MIVEVDEVRTACVDCCIYTLTCISRKKHIQKTTQTVLYYSIYLYYIIRSFSKKGLWWKLDVKSIMCYGNSNNSRFWTFLNQFLILQAEESKLCVFFLQFVFVFHCWAKKKEKGIVKAECIQLVSVCINMYYYSVHQKNNRRYNFLS